MNIAVSELFFYLLEAAIDNLHFLFVEFCHFTNRFQTFRLVSRQYWRVIVAEQSIIYLQFSLKHKHFFRLKIANAENVGAKGFMATRMEPNPDISRTKEMLMTGTGVLKSKDQNTNRLTLMGFEKDLISATYLDVLFFSYVPNEAPPTAKPNFLAIQMTSVGASSFEIVFESVVPGQKPQEVSGFGKTYET